MPTLLLELLIIIFLILLNGFFAASELAVVSARRTRLQQMAQEGSRGAAAALELADNPNRFLSTVQVGITLIGIVAGAYGGATLSRELASLMGRVPWLAPAAGIVSFLLVVGLITFLSVVVGELVPKRIALQRAERLAALVARPMSGLAWLAGPVVRLFSAATEAVVKLLGLPAVPDSRVSEEEIQLLVEESAQAGVILEAERDMVESVLRLDDVRLRALMTPRPEITWLDVNSPQEKIEEAIRTSSHSRLPVCDGDLDHVIGVVRAKDLLADVLAQRPIDLRAAMQEPLFTPESMRALRALERFRQSGVHLAVVIDEYGGVEGLVTLIDILEAIVGDIPTPDELAAPPIVQREDGSWLVDGLLAIDEFKEAFELENLPGEGKYQTVGGLIVFMLGSIPRPGDHFGWGGFRFEVADMDAYRVDKVLVEKGPEAGSKV